MLFHSCCSHAIVFGKTPAHESPVSYSHTEWYLLFSLETTWSKWSKCLLSKTNYNNNNIIFISIIIIIKSCERRRVDDFSFFDCSSSFHFLLIEFHCTFFIYYIKCYQIMFIIVFWFGTDRLSDSFFSYQLYFFPSPRLYSYLLCLFFFISFLLFPCASVLENTYAWVPHFLYSHTEWYLLFFALWK